MRQQCSNVLDTDENEHDVACSESAIYLFDGQPRCQQCGHDWLDGLATERVHTVRLISARADQPAPTETARLRHINEWHEDMGNVLWWTQPVSEPPHVGSPLDSDWPEYHEWWEPLPSDPTPRNYSKDPRLAHEKAEGVR